MGYAITSESQLIDINAIESGCNIIRAAGNSFKTCAKKVEEAADICNINALSLDNATMQPIMYDMAQEINKFKNYVDTFADNIMEAAYSILKIQKNELASYYESLNKTDNV